MPIVVTLFVLIAGAGYLFVVAPGLVRGASSPPFAIDGTATGGTVSGSTASATLSTKYSNDLIVVFLSVNASSPAGTCSDAKSLSWTTRSSHVWQSPDTFEMWAKATSALSSDTITCSIYATGNIAMVAFGVSGVNLSAPFDSSSSFPASKTGTTSVPSMTVTTTYSPDLLVSFWAVNAYEEYGEPVNLSQVAFTSASSSAGPFGEVAAASIPASQWPFYWVWNGKSPWALIADAIRAAPGECAPIIGPISMTNVQVTVNPTNATVMWSETPDWSTSTTYLNWATAANWSAGLYYTQNVPFASTFSVFLNFLQPSKTYDYEIVVNPASSYSCAFGYTQGTYSSSWTASSELNYINTWGNTVRGTVQDVNGGIAPNFMSVQTYCESSPGNTWSSSTQSGTGEFVIQLGIGLGSNWGPCEGLVVQVLNNPGLGGQTWNGRWNETAVLWAPQFVNFVLPLNFVSGPVVQIADFSNAITSNGFPNSTIGYASGSAYTTSSSFCWTALWFLSGCSSTSKSTGTSTLYQADGGNLVVTQQLWESGTVLFSAISRTSVMTALNYYAAYLPPVNEPSTWSIQDTLTPSAAASNSSIYLLYNAGGAGSENHGLLVYQNRPVGGNLTVSSTTTSYQVEGFTVDVGVDIYGLDISTAVASVHWSQTSSYTVTDTLQWMVYGNSLTVPLCYVVYGVGGSGSSATSTSDAIGVWAYLASDSGGTYSCPLPT